jgi:GntR family transcriptional regulator, transcriptional repressor for pyruvate dehydrogenase complex
MKDETHQVIEHIREIPRQTPVDIIIRQIRDLLSAGVLKPGDRLPAERALADRFGVGRGYIRQAIRRLELYGILRTYPQSGTVVAGLGVKAFEGVIASILNLEREDFESILETRAILEIQAARLAATRASAAEIAELEQIHEEFCRQGQWGASGLDEDLQFHLKIAECTRNSVLRSLINLLTPDIVTLAKSRETPQDGRFLVALREHEAVLNGIRSREPDRAAAAMEEHIRKVRLQVESYGPEQSPIEQE